MTELVNFKWPQGEDLNIELLYKEGDSTKTAKPVSLSSGYDLRMDIVNASGSVLYSFLSDEHPGTLRSGLNNTPNIVIYLPRALTLTGGELHNMPTVQYDIFLRNTATDKQFKLIRGSISFEKSNTLWP